MHEYEVTSLALYYERSTSRNFVIFALYRTYSLIFLHTGHISTFTYAKTSFVCTFRRQVQKFTQVRQYDVTGFIYTKTFSTIVISDPKTRVSSLISAQYLISFEFHIRQYLPKVPGTLSENYENL